MNNAQVGIAREKARRLLKELKVTEPPVRLAPFIKHLGITTAPHTIDDKLSGATGFDPESNESYIIYNENHHVHRQRFTVAHELGHVAFDHTNYKEDNPDFHSKDDAEIEANQFAAELLMPLTMLKADVSRLGTVKKLAFRYWVSEEAMTWRLMDTNLFKKLQSWN